MSDYPPNTVIPGTIYQVIRLLGHGGMGTVYEVEDTTVGKRYVLKTLAPQLRDRKEIALRLNKEARVLARLAHPNIVDVVTAGMTGDAQRLPFFVMQKLNGHTLRSVLNAKGCLPLETAYSIGIDLLDALEHAHGLGIIHRDVKPENIFLHRGANEMHQTKLLDFGVMRMLSGDQPQTGGRFVGTLRYAPPEQLQGGPITPQTDLYAAALVLYEMIAGGGPFDDEITDRGVANAHLEKPAPRLATRALVGPELDDLIFSALSKDPTQRPKDAYTFAARLRELSAVGARRGVVALASPIGRALDGVRAPSGPDPRTATTTGAVSSHATKLRQRAAKAGVGLVVAVVLTLLGVAVLTRWRVADVARGVNGASAHATSSFVPVQPLPPPPSASAPLPVTAPLPTARANPSASAPARGRPSGAH